MLDCSIDPPLASNPKSWFTKEMLAALKGQSIPNHVAIMMDGNRRWAKLQPKSMGLCAYDGHSAGAKGIFDIVEAAREIGIKVLTLWAFSTENWQRSSVEVKILMHIFEQYLLENRQKMVDKGVKFSVIGNLTPLPMSVKKEIEKTKEATKFENEIELVIAFNYGGKDDITRAFIKIAEKLEKKELAKEAISESLIASHLDTAQWFDPDLIIRTSAEIRVSNFMLWQLAYSELYVTEVLWPDFKPVHLLEAILDFQKRQRRIGK